MLTTASITFNWYATCANLHLIAAVASLPFKPKLHLADLSTTLQIRTNPCLRLPPRDSSVNIQLLPDQHNVQMRPSGLSGGYNLSVWQMLTSLDKMMVSSEVWLKNRVAPTVLVDASCDLSGADTTSPRSSSVASGSTDTGSDR